MMVSLTVPPENSSNSKVQTVGDQMILPDQLDKIGMPNTHLKVKDPKTGIEGYRVGLEVFHQLHCINLLRQVTYRDWYEDISGEFKEGQKGLRMHTGILLIYLVLS